MTMLWVAAMLAPLVGVDPDMPDVAHRVNLDGLPVATLETAKWATAVCGIEVKLVTFTPSSEAIIACVQWENLRTRGTPITRCKACHPSRKKA